MNDWRAPYRTMDASGSPEAAGAVGHAWLIDIAIAESQNDPLAVTLDENEHALYRDCKLIAAYHIIRDPMNFAVLIRWKAPA